MDTSSFRKDALIVGVGGAGLIVAGKLALSYPDIADYAAISRNRHMLSECPIGMKYFMWINSDDPCSVGCFSSLKELVETHKDELAPLYESPHSKIIIIAGLGCDSGTAIPVLVDEFKLRGKQVTAMVSIPFLFEGAKKFQRVMTIVHELKDKEINTIFVDLQNLVNLHPELDFTNCFSIADQEIINIILEMFKDNDVIVNEIQSQDAPQPMRLSTESYSEEYGQVQTLCDIIKVLNEKNHYQSIEPLFNDMAKVMARYVRRGTISERTRRTINAGMLNDEDVFSNGVLDVAKLRQSLLDRIKSGEDDIIEEVMAKRDVFKLSGLVQYMNEFRRYTSSDEIREDLCRYVFDGITSCGDFSKSRLNDKMFNAPIPMGGHAYPYIAFFQAIDAMWPQVTTDGLLDNSKLQQVMINRYQEDRDKYGLFSLAINHYEQDSSCHPEVYVPQKGKYYGPVLVENYALSRRLIESCGEGKGPYKTDDFYEYQILKQLIASDPKYVSVDNGLLIPKEDYSLPVYGPMGKIPFASKDFIKQKLLDNNIPIPQSEVDNDQSKGSWIKKMLDKIQKNGRNER